MTEVLVLARSARALAVSAAAAGYTVHALDCYGDTDLRAVAASWRSVAGADGDINTDAVLAAAGTAPLRGLPLIYGSGLERRAGLLETLSRGRRLCGNRAEVLERLAEARAFFRILDRLRIAYPAVRMAASRAGGPWLIKRAGAAGGGHVRAYEPGAVLPDGCYLQRRVSGRVVSVSFVAAGGKVRILGFALAFPAQAGAGAFRHGGLVSVPAPRGGAVIKRWARQLTRALGLRGLNGIDCMVAPSGRVMLLDLNARPGASAFLPPMGNQAMALHVDAALRRRLPTVATPPPGGHGSGVVYALDAGLTVADAPWPRWVADRPAPGTRIAAGQPICTVYGSGPTMQRAMRAVRHRAAIIEHRCKADAD